MSQFDSLIIFSLLWGLLLSLLLYYNLTIKFLIPSFFGTRKFREKKLNLYTFYKFLNENSEIKASSSAISAI
jgi:hypothetical protein